MVRLPLAHLNEQRADVGVHTDATVAGDVQEARDEGLRVWIFVKVCRLGKGVAEDMPENQRDALAISETFPDSPEMSKAARAQERLQPSADLPVERARGRGGGHVGQRGTSERPWRSYMRSWCKKPPRKDL